MHVWTLKSATIRWDAEAAPPRVERPCVSPVDDRTPLRPVDQLLGGDSMMALPALGYILSSTEVASSIVLFTRRAIAQMRSRGRN